MIIQGKLGTYDVRWGDFGFNRAEIMVFKGSVYRKLFFGLVTTKNRCDYQTFGRRVRTPEEVRAYTDEQMENWFWEAVIEYEQKLRVKQAARALDRELNGYFQGVA